MPALEGGLRGRVSQFAPRAIGSVTAQSLNAFAGGIGALFVLNNSAPTLSILTELAYAITLQTVVAFVIAVACKFGQSDGIIRFLGVLTAGMLRGVLLWLILREYLPVISLYEGLSLVFGSILFTSLWILTAGHFIQGSRNYQAAFAVLFEQALHASSRDSTNSAAWREANDLASSEQISARSKIEAVSTNPDLRERSDISRNMITVANEIHQAAHDRVRPASHRMWAAGARRPPALGIWTVVSRALSTWPAPVGVAVSLSAFITGFGALVSRGPEVGLFTGMVVGLVTALLLSMRNHIQVRTKTHDFLTATTLLLIFPITFISMEALGRLISLPPDLPGIAVVSMASVTLSFVCIALNGVQQHRSDLLSEMRNLLETGFWQTQLDRAAEGRHATDAATYLHHKVQSQLLAVALQLELAAQSEDHSVLNETLNRARGILDSPAERPTVLDSGYQSLTELPSEWEGICSVHLSIPDREDLSDSMWGVIDSVLRELIANAVRSGRANEVDIDVMNNRPNVIKVIVQDNGIGPTGAMSGLGTTWLRTVANNLKVTKNAVGGTTVIFDLALGN